MAKCRWLSRVDALSLAEPEPSGALEAEGEGVGIPQPPQDPLPPLSALSRAQPSPLLRWQLLDILYAYCITMHLYNGDWRAEPQV
jgi:hypothetical protein